MGATETSPSPVPCRRRDGACHNTFGFSRVGRVPTLWPRSHHVAGCNELGLTCRAASPPGGATATALTCCCSSRVPRQLHERPALTSCRMSVSQESRRSTPHSPVGQPYGAHAGRVRHTMDPVAPTARRAFVLLEAAAARPALLQRSTGSRWAHGSPLRRRGERGMDAV